jgi:hypothetical protein
MTTRSTVGPTPTTTIPPGGCDSAACSAPWYQGISDFFSGIWNWLNSNA